MVKTDHLAVQFEAPSVKCNDHNSFCGGTGNFREWEVVSQELLSYPTDEIILILLASCKSPDAQPNVN